MNKGMLRIVGFSAVLLTAATAFAYTYTTQVTLKFADDVGSANNSGTLVIGNATGRQMALDDNEIQARAANGGVSTLYLNHSGGSVEIGGDVDVDFSSAISASGVEVISFGGLGGADDTEVNFTGPFNSFWGQAFFESRTVFRSNTDFESTTRLKPAQISSGFSMCIAGTGLSTVGFCSSSRKYKTDIVTLRSGLREVMAMRPVSYVWKEGGKHDLGFIAEEAVEVQPELVLRDAQGEVQSFDYQHYTAVLTRAIQEQQSMIQALRQQLDASAAKQTRAAEALATRETQLAEQQKNAQARDAEMARLRDQVAALAHAVAALQKTSATSH